MSLNSKKSEWMDWIEDAISKECIKYYDYEYFYNIEETGSGSFGKVYRANWKNSHKYLTLKSFFNLNDATVKEIVDEVYLFFMLYILYNLLSVLRF